ncbi:hypothetical protein ACQY0O_003586 [Thecaphora frezii]
MMSAISWPHPALDPSTHLIPSLKSFLPSFLNAFNRGSLISLQTYKTYYQDADPMHSAVAFCGVVTAYVWIMEKITGNASQVDGLWTFLPLIYSAHFTFHKYFTYQPAKLALLGGVEHASFWDKVEPRLALMTALSLLWCIRLTYNAYRRGMFKPGEEDYRWPILRAGMSRPVWEIFSFFFIAIIQNILLAVTAMPQYLLLTTTSVKHVTEPVPRPLNRLCVGDWVLAGLFVLNLAVQFVADQQQWNYQNYKRGLDPQGKPLRDSATTTASVATTKKTKHISGTSSAAQVVSTASESVVRKPMLRSEFTPYSFPEDADRGFVTRGLWAWSRHPNFACEQTTWWILYLYVPLTFLPHDLSAAAWQHLITYAVVSPLAMNLLFYPSARFSEAVSAAKYPAYADYQRRVGMFFPFETLVKSFYYNLFASREEKHRVETNVWGRSDITQKKRL